MNTNPQKSPPIENDDPVGPSEDDSDALMQLLEELDNIDEGSEEATLNKCSISDNNGGRIELMKRHIQKLSAFVFLRRLMPRKRAKPEQGDGA